MTDMAKRKLKRKAVRIPKPAEILRERKRLGLTQEKAAEKIGVSRRSWVAYEQGDPIPAPVAILMSLLFDGTIK